MLSEVEVPKILSRKLSRRRGFFKTLILNFAENLLPRVKHRSKEYDLPYKKPCLAFFPFRFLSI